MKQYVRFDIEPPPNEHICVLVVNNYRLEDCKVVRYEGNDEFPDGRYCAVTPYGNWNFGTLHEAKVWVMDNSRSVRKST